MERNCKLIFDGVGYCAEFTSRERRVKRRLTAKEAERLAELLENGDVCAIDEFCYRIA